MSFDKKIKQIKYFRNPELYIESFFINLTIKDDDIRCFFYKKNKIYFEYEKHTHFFFCNYKLFLLPVENKLIKTYPNKLINTEYINNFVYLYSEKHLNINFYDINRILYQVY